MHCEEIHSIHDTHFPTTYLISSVERAWKCNRFWNVNVGLDIDKKDWIPGHNVSLQLSVTLYPGLWTRLSTVPLPILHGINCTSKLQLAS
jgi:hypothetical protein